MKTVFRNRNFILCFAIFVWVCGCTASAYGLQNKENIVMYDDAQDLNGGSQYIGNREIVEDDYFNSDTQNKLFDLMLSQSGQNRYQPYKPMYPDRKMQAEKRYVENSVGNFMGRYKQYQIFKLRESLLQQMLYPKSYSTNSGRKRDENIIKYLKNMQNKPMENWKMLENMET